jgi:tetratricopeptide (TPR) repeat protein
MKILSSEEHLSKFLVKQKNNTFKNDGLVFENLVENLLNLEFDHLNWEKTKTSWDGAKDFIGHKDGVLDVWAECKMYQNTLQLNVISKTLIMAINYQINRIIIFSWSKLTPGTIKELANFSSTTKTHIQVFDDELLEDLIFKHINNKTIKKFFPNVNEQSLKIRSFKPKIEQFFSAEIQLDSIQIDHSKDKSNPRSNQIYIDTPCMFQIMIYPNTIEEAEVVVDLSKIFKKEQVLGVLNKEKLDIDKFGKISKKMSPGEIYSLKIYFAPSQKGHQEIPACDIFINENKHHTTAVKFDVTKLTRPILVGGSVVQALKNFHAKISHNNLIYTAAIDGFGGVGKSRFLEECISKLLKENYRVCKLDGKGIQCKNFNLFVVELLTQLWKLPNPKIFKDEFSALELQTLEKDDDYFIYLGLYEIIRMCTLSEQTVSNEIENKIYQLFQEGFLKQSRIAILIDNVQSLDSKSISLVRNLTEQTGIPGQNVSLLTFNKEELIYSHEAASFYEDLKEKLPNDCNGLFFTLNEFSENEVILFVDAHLKSTNSDLTFSKQYPLLFESICKHIQPRPLDLYLFFYLLLDEKVVELDDGMFFINDFEAFNNILIGVGKKTEDILIQRLNKLQNNLESLDVLILLMCFGEIDVDSLIKKLGVKYETIENLANGCWIKIHTDKKITFYHPKIERFIIEKEYSLLEVRGTAISDLLNNNIDMKNYPLVNFAINPSENQILPKAIDELLKLSTLNARNKLFATKIYNCVTGKFSNVDPVVYLKAIQKICNLIAENSTDDIIEKLSHFNEILNDYIPKESEAKLYFQVIRQHASYLCAKDPYKSISIINDGLSKLNVFKKNFSEEVTNFISMNLKNRLSFCYRTIREQDKARKVGEEALNIAKKTNNLPFICLCYVDLGYIFLEAAKDKKKLIEYWDEAVNFFNQNKESIKKEDISIALAVMVVEAYLYAIKNKAYREAISKAEEIINLSKEHFYMHSEILGILAKTIFEFKQRPYSCDGIIALADSLIDRTLVSYDYKNQSKAYHLKAIALSKKEGKNNEAYIHFKYGLKVLENKKYLSVADEALIWDAISFSKRQEKKFGALIPSCNIRNNMAEYNKIEIFFKDEETANLFMIFADNEYNFPV